MEGKNNMGFYATGIYCIENIINGKKYIGKSVNIPYRLTGHKWALSENRHPNQYLQYSYNKYGLEHFKFYILEECDKNILSEREIYFIKKYKAKNKEFGYNLTDGGEGAAGRVVTLESRKKVSISNTGKVRSEEVKKQMSIRAKARAHTEEENKKISLSTIGKQRGFRKGKNSSYLGVSRGKNRKKYKAQITYKQKVFSLGACYSEVDAAKLYDSAAFYLYGENAILNFPEDYTGERECGINVLRDKFRL